MLRQRKQDIPTAAGIGVLLGSLVLSEYVPAAGFVFVAALGVGACIAIYLAAGCLLGLLGGLLGR